MAGVSINTTIAEAQTWATASVSKSTWETVGFASSIWQDFTRFLHALSVEEDVSLVDALANAIAIARSEAFASTDGDMVVKEIGKDSIEPFSMDDERAAGVDQQLDEQIPFDEQLANAAAIAKSEAFVVTDGDEVAKEIVKDSIESITLDDERAVGMSQQLDEQIPFDEQLANGMTRGFDEAFGMTDDDLIVKDMLKNSMESLAVDEVRVMEMWQELAEALAIDEQLTNDFARQVSEAFGVTSSVAKLMIVDSLVDLGFTEEVINAIGLSVDERLDLVDLVTNDMISEQKDGFRFTESIAKSVQQENYEVFAFAEAFARTVKFIRDFAESVALDDDLAKTFEKLELQDFNVMSEMVVPAFMVIADMLIERLDAGQDVEFRDFLQSIETGAIPGWAPWRSFVPGDYEYSKAMFRVVMDSISADRGQIEVCEAAMDVPDVIDRGSARVLVAADGVYVEFEREYHIIPEITLTSKGGVGTNPTAAELVGAPTLLGFTAKLRDTMTGELVAGTFTWASHGY